MPDFNTHICKYQHNKNFVSFGINNKKETFDDWEIVADFYACIHLIEAILYKEFSEDADSHKDRWEKMTSHPIIFNSKLIKFYGSLKLLAWTARYKGMIETESEDALKAQEYLESIESELSQYIS